MFAIICAHEFLGLGGIIFQLLSHVAFSLAKIRRTRPLLLFSIVERVHFAFKFLPKRNGLQRICKADFQS